MSMPARLGSGCLRIAIVAVAGLVVGCDSGGVEGPPRQAVSGTVTLDGKPLPEGTISFQPAGGAAATQADAAITDGKYEIPSDRGLAPGRYTVRIAAVKAQEAPAAAIPGETYPKAAKESIPKKYNTASTLTAEVKSGEPGSFDFPLKSR